jgi:hypothetical protein
VGGVGRPIKEGISPEISRGHNWVKHTWRVGFLRCHKRITPAKQSRVAEATEYIFPTEIQGKSQPRHGRGNHNQRIYKEAREGKRRRRHPSSVN